MEKGFTPTQFFENMFTEKYKWFKYPIRVVFTVKTLIIRFMQTQMTYFKDFDYFSVLLSCRVATNFTSLILNLSILQTFSKKFEI